MARLFGTTLTMALSLAMVACVASGEEDVSHQDLATNIGIFDGFSNPAAPTAFGWAYDPDRPGSSVNVHIYVKNSAGTLLAVYGVPANQPRPDVNAAMNITGNHGWSWRIPEAYQTGKYTLEVYGIDLTGDPNPQLSRSPRSYTGYNPPADVQNACHHQLTWTSSTASLTDVNNFTRRTGLRDLVPARDTVIVLGQSVDTLLLDGLRSKDTGRNYIWVPCDDQRGYWNRYSWTNVMNTWVIPFVEQFDTINYVTVGQTWRALCADGDVNYSFASLSGQTDVASIARWTIEALRARLPGAAVRGLSYPSALSVAPGSRPLDANQTTCLGGVTGYYSKAATYKNHVSMSNNSWLSTWDIWTGSYATSDGLHPTTATRNAAADLYLSKLNARQ